MDVIEIKLRIGDMSENGQVTIVDEDRLCYLVKSISKGAIGLRTISKALLDEFVTYMRLHPDVPANEVRFKISGQSDIDKYEYGYGATLVVMANMILGNTGIIKSTQAYVPETLSSAIHLNLPLQQIFYGAPGTGKSNTIKKEVDEKDRINFRTTFHPDSDYSTFVGCYKPRTKEVPMRDVTGKVIVEEGHLVTEKCIEYSFVPQAFTKAYTAAWNTEEPVFLIIEEINRGNCAQIFGDLFQLLDRKDGESEYPIDADTDLASHIARELANSTREIPEDVKSGRLLKLPANLYIWATMNTSDQSLFPIDSAFKRRWEWKYMPIAQGRKDGKPIAWRIGADGNEYDWWSFVQKINEQIGTTTSSEDKKLGFFFAKADSAGLISADKFVGKVLFYLWNDVFKDYGLDGGIFALEDVDGALTYDKFYTVDTTGKTVVRKDLVEKYLAKLGVEKVNAINEEEAYDERVDISTLGQERKDTLSSVSINGMQFTEQEYTQFDLYMNVLREIGIDRAGASIESMKFIRKGSKMATQNPLSHLADGYTYVKEGEYYFIKGANPYTLIRILEELKKILHLDMVIAYR